jgi:adenylate cyclase
MTELFSRSAVVVKHYGGTIDKFTGDGIMALFCAPVALEEHAFRACLAALEIQPCRPMPGSCCTSCRYYACRV